MFNSQAAQVFRSCTGALSSRTLARSSVNAVGRRAAFAARSRYYSDKAESAEGSKKAEEGEKDEVDVSPETTLLNKLKEEEAKVADCMVSILSRPNTSLCMLPRVRANASPPLWPRASWQPLICLCAESVTIPPGRLLEPPA